MLGLVIRIKPIPRETYAHIPAYIQTDRLHATIEVGQLSRTAQGITSDVIQKAIIAGHLHNGQIVGNVFFDIHHGRRQVHFSNYEPISPRHSLLLKRKGIGTRVDIFLFKWLVKQHPSFRNYSILTGKGTSKERQAQLLQRGRATETTRTIGDELVAAQQQARRNYQKNKPKQTRLQRAMIRARLFFRRRK